MGRWRMRWAVALGVLLAVGGATARAGEPRAGWGPPTGAPLWVRQSVSTLTELAVSTAQDGHGNVIVLLGFLGDSLDLGSGPLPGSASAAPGAYNTAVVKLAPDGTVLWGRTFGAVPGSGPSPFSVDPQAVAVDWQGNISFLALFRGTVDFGGGPLVAGDVLGAALVKVDRHGRHLWSRLLRIGLGGGFHVPLSLASDGVGNVAIAGGYEGTSDFGAGPVTAPGTDPGSAFLAKFSASGTFEWLYLDRLHMGSEVNGVTADKDGHFLIAGGIRAFEGSRPFVHKLSPRGELVWTRTLEGVFGEARDVAVHANRIVVVGGFSGSFLFGGQRLTAGAPPGGTLDASDMFVLAFTADGGERWARHFGRTARAVAMDQEDGVVVLGSFEPGDDLGLGPLGGVPGVDQPFVAKLDRVDGETLWARAIPYPGLSPIELSVARTGESAVVGSFSRPVDVGVGTLVPHGPEDAFILKLAP